MSVEVQKIARMILDLNAAETLQLKQILDEWGEGGAEAVGVREPRTPAPSAGRVGEEIEDDYWESAE